MMERTQFAVEPSVLQVDQMFANSAKYIRNYHIRYVLYHILKFILLVSFVSVYFQDGTTNPEFRGPYIVAIILSVLYISAYAIVIQIVQFNLTKMVRIAEMLHHIISVPNVSATAAAPSLWNRVNDLYDINNPGSDAPGEAEQRREQSHLAKFIVQHIFMETHCIGTIVNASNLTTITMIIYFIVLLASHAAQPSLIAVTVIYVIMQSIAKYDVLLMLVVCAFSPIILCYMCLVVFRRKTTQQSPGEPPALESVVFAPGVKLQGEPDCKICFQEFKVDDQINILPCDSKHYFHKFCIDSWFRVSITCPLCRKNLGV